MKILNLDEIILKTFGSRTGRFNYFLSILIVIVGFYYIDTFFYSDRCLVCRPILSFPWRDLIKYFVMIALTGVYFCILLCWMWADNSFTIGLVYMPILFTCFFIIQTIRRCHDVDRSGWRFLIPIYSPLFLLFLPKDLDVDEEPVRTSIWSSLWQSKWLLIVLILLCAYIYLLNARYIHIHNSI